MPNKCRPHYCMCGCTLPQRVAMCLVLAFGVIICCGQRDYKTMGVAVYLARIVGNNTTIPPVSSILHGNSTLPDIQETNIDMSEITLNVLLSAFPVGHFIGQLPAGILADELQTRWILFTGVATSTVITFLLPVMISYCDLLVLNFVRMFSGVSQSVLYPYTSVLLAHWVPFSERGKLGGFVFSIYPLAGIVADAVGEVTRITDPYKWKLSYYIWGGIGVIWCLLYGLYVYSSPEVHPRIAQKEKAYLARALPSFGKIKRTWSNLFRHQGIWALIIGQIGHNFTLHLMLIDLPWNLHMILGVPKPLVGIMSLIPFAGFVIISTISGAVIDYGVVKRKWNLKWTRRIATYITFVFPNTFLCIAFYLRSYPVFVAVFYALAILLSGSYSASFRVNHLDITVNAAGFIIAIINFMGDIVAFCLFVIVRVILSTEKVLAWEINTWVAFALALVCTTQYLFMAQVERAAWDIPIESETKS